MDIKKIINDIEPYAKGWDISIGISRTPRTLGNYISTPKQKFNKKKILETIEDGDVVDIINLTKNSEKYSIMFYDNKICAFHQSKYFILNNLILKGDEYKKAFDIINEIILFDAKLKELL